MRTNIPDGNRIIVPENYRMNIPGYSPVNSYVWWDSSDSNSVVIQTGVSELKDKGSLGFNLVQPNASNQPSYNIVQQNSHPTITFDRNYEQCLSKQVQSAGLDDVVFSIAFKPYSVSNPYQSIFSYNGDTSDFQIDSDDGAKWYGRFNSSNYGQKRYSANAMSNIPLVLSILANTSSGTLEGYLNKNLVWSISGYAGWDNTDISLKLCSNRASTRYLSCDFYEMVVLPPEEKDSIIDYLIDKWGI